MSDVCLKKQDCVWAPFNKAHPLFLLQTGVDLPKRKNPGQTNAQTERTKEHNLKRMKELRT